MSYSAKRLQAHAQQTTNEKDSSENSAAPLPEPDEKSEPAEGETQAEEVAQDYVSS
jgi:hypothetical protein